MSPQTIAIDGQTLSCPEYGSGIGRYYRGLLRHLVPLLDGHRVVVTVGREDDAATFRRDISPDVEFIVHPIFGLGRIAPSGEPLRDVWDGRDAFDGIAGRLLGRESVDVHLDINPLMPLKSVFRRPQPFRLAVLVHDMIALRMSDLYLEQWTELVRAVYMHQLAAVAETAETCLFTSQSTRQDYVDMVAARREDQRHHVIYAGIDETFLSRPLAGKANAPPYILAVANLDTRKNLLPSFRVFDRLRALCRGTRWEGIRYRVACNVGPQHFDRIRAFFAQHGIGDDTQMISGADDAVLRLLYQQAELLFFPSAYEGFGFPVIEALACGTAVVRQANSSLAEFACDGWVFPLRLGDIDEMAEDVFTALADKSDDPAVPTAYVQRFTWQAVAERVRAALLG